MSDAILPSRIIPPGAPLPVRPPDPPRTAPSTDWWNRPPAPPAPRPPVPPPYHLPPTGQVDVHVTLSWATEPEPAAWWQRIRWGYNAACFLCSAPLAAPWAYALASIRDTEGLAGAWTLAAVPLTVLAVLDNARRVEAEHALPGLWAPRIRAAGTRTLLWAGITATAMTLPAATLVYAITGVRT